jgi:hypothetical protein
MSERGNATLVRDCAALYIRMLLNGGSPNGAPPEAFGAWRDMRHHRNPRVGLFWPGNVRDSQSMA